MSNKYKKGVVIIKKISFLMVALLIFSMVSCEVKDSSAKDKELSVSIAANIDNYERYMTNVNGIALMPKVEGYIDEEMEYHWSIDSDTEAFDSSNGPQNEVINYRRLWW